MRAIGLAVVLVLAGIGAGEAKSLSRIVAQTGLAPEDFNLLTETGRRLYTATPPRTGGVLSWTNPDSGSHGKAKLVGMRKNCAFMQHIVHVKARPKPVELRLRRCKSDDGRWLLQP